MWRNKASSKEQIKDQQHAGRDIIQLYNSESKAQRERSKKIIEIQRKARRKDHEDEKIMRRKDHDSRNHSLEAKGRIEMRKNSRAKTGYSIMKLPLIETQSRPNKTRRWSKRSIMKDEDEHFLPNIDVVGNSRTNVRGARVKEPSRDPRFQGLISSLMINADYYGDLQRFAPPRREISKQTRLGLGF